MKKHIFESHNILCIGIFNGFDSLKNYPNVYTYHSIYKKLHGIDRYIYKLGEHGISLGNNEDWYGDWKYLLNKVDTVMLSDGIRGRDIVEYIHKKNPRARIIIYYMNPNFGEGRNAPLKYKDLPCELVTFDEKNAKDYKIDFKHYYYPYMNIRSYKADTDFKQDIFFIGEDKGRLGTLLHLKKFFESHNLKCKFLILKTKHKFYWCHRNELINESVSYEEVIKEIKNSRAVLDIVQDRQHGITYRPMEAMCFQKKLITNFEEITHYNFYNKNNIFRLGHDNINDIEKFILSPYTPIDDEIRKEYVIENWMDSFFEVV